MIRACFLCHSKTEVLHSSNWALPGLATTKIGFSICPDCGSVCQSPSISFDDMMTFYDSIAVYTNPGRNERPSESKIRDVDEQIQFIKRGMRKLSQSVLQIGSSDGYTLSRFKLAGVEKVVGVEPSSASVALAKSLYQIQCFHGGFESFYTDEKFELIILTHVLEHIYEPQRALEKCRLIQNTSAESFIYIEVPLMTRLESSCPGFFTFEHVNYYTRDNLLRSLDEVGYFPISLVEHYNSNLSPIIGVLASTKKQSHYCSAKNEYQKNKQLVTDYIESEKKVWVKALASVIKELKTNGNTYIWGAGIHTCQLIANTDILQQLSIKGLTDSSPLRWNLIQGDWVCTPPQDIDWVAGDKVIISSFASQEEIYKSLSWLRDKGIKTLRLHSAESHKDS